MWLAFTGNRAARVGTGESVSLRRGQQGRGAGGVVYRGSEKGLAGTHRDSNFHGAVAHMLLVDQHRHPERAHLVADVCDIVRAVLQVNDFVRGLVLAGEAHGDKGLVAACESGRQRERERER